MYIYIYAHECYRFGHEAISVGMSTVLIYGGMGCKAYSLVTVNKKQESRCTELTVLDDLWEFNVVKGLAGEHAILSIYFSPTPSGRQGMSAGTLPMSDNRILIFGGSSVFHPLTLLSQASTLPVKDAFQQVRDFHFRAGKAATTELDIPEVSSNVKVQNSSHVILFGGFVGNSLSSAVFIYQIAATTASLGFDAVSILSDRSPSLRGYPGLVKPDDSTLVMFGGYSKGSGRSDMWKLNLDSSLWTLAAKQEVTNAAKAYPTAFNAFSYFYVDGSLVLASVGGLRGGYRQGVSFVNGPSSTNNEYSITEIDSFFIWPSDGTSFTGDASKMINLYPKECCSANNPSSSEQAQCASANYYGTADQHNLGTKSCPYEPRAMHTATFGYFVAGQPAVLLYGGVNQNGNSLQDLVYVDMALNALTSMAPPADGASTFVFRFDFSLGGVADVSTWPADRTSMWSDLETIFAKHVELMMNMYFNAGYCPSTWKDCRVSWAALDVSDFAFHASSNTFSCKVVLRQRTGTWAVMAFLPGAAASVHWNQAREQVAGLLTTSIFNSSTLSCPGSSIQVPCFVQNHGAPFDAALAISTYDDTASCDPTRPGAKCMRGMCMGTTEGTKGQITTDSHDDVQYCYRQGAAMTECTTSTRTLDDTTGEETTTTVVNKDYSCSLPGKRHGHRATRFTLLGTVSLLAIFGGESTDLLPADKTSTSALSNDVHTLHFTSTTVTWIKLWTSCDDGYQFGVGEPVCPEKRRDAAVAIMGNNGAESGRLIVFGGFGGKSEDVTSALSYHFGMKNYLDNVFDHRVKVFDDIWYLDLGNLDLACVSNGKCTSTIMWHRVEVPGSVPSSGFGAGVLLDPSERLYIIGGVDSMFQERDELFVFQLRDPFYKHCSATGSALVSGIAGVQSVFYVQCLDSFLEPADGASLAVKISGPVDVIPGIVNLGNGKYSCSFTPIKVGNYVLSIKVGRGGSEHQDLITGRDTEPSNNEHEFEKACAYSNDQLVCKEEQNPYALTVVPGSTSPAVSLAMGSSITLSTVGTASNFVITAKDAFGNRRPGGDFISVVMREWTCTNEKGESYLSGAGDIEKCLRKGALTDPTKTPETGTVLDNSDGSYSTSYLITKAGTYAVSVRFSGMAGAGSPFVLKISTEVADQSRTYVYGAFQSISAGASSVLYVQTRDKFGNHVMADEEEFPLGETNGGNQRIDFILCRTISNDESSLCGGGELYTAVGVSLRYAVGPDGRTTNPETGDPYFGLYEVTYFPFVPEAIVPFVLHGEKDETNAESACNPTDCSLVQCYFDTTGAPSVSQMDPGAGSANLCYDEVQNEEGVAQRIGRRRLPFSRLPRVKIVPSRDNGRRASRLDSGTSVPIKQTFSPPDTTILQFWLVWGPISCALVGAFVAVIVTSISTWKHLRHKQIFAAVQKLEQDESMRLPTSPKKNIPASPENPQVEPTLEQGSVGKTILQEMVAQGLLTQQQYCSNLALLEAHDSRVMGAIDFHERNRLRTALILSKLASNAAAPSG